jgi:hypothetical protein
LAPQAPFRPPLLTTPLYRQKGNTLIFPRFIEVAVAVKPLPPSRGVRSCRYRAPKKGEITAIFTTSPPWHRGASPSPSSPRLGPSPSSSP